MENERINKIARLFVAKELVAVPFGIPSWQKPDPKWKQNGFDVEVHVDHGQGTEWDACYYDIKYTDANGESKSIELTSKNEVKKFVNEYNAQLKNQISALEKELDALEKKSDFIEDFGDDLIDKAQGMCEDNWEELLDNQGTEFLDGLPYKNEDEAYQSYEKEYLNPWR